MAIVVMAMFICAEKPFVNVYRLFLFNKFYS